MFFVMTNKIRLTMIDLKLRVPPFKTTGCQKDIVNKPADQNNVD